MKIEIVDRLAAFSHRPGCSMMIPASIWSCHVFPTKLELVCLQTKKTVIIHWDLKGPIDPFTVEQDLEKEKIFIYGQAKQGYFRFSLAQEADEIIFCVEKVFSSGVMIEQKLFFSKDQIVLVRGLIPKIKKPRERLFLGVNKKKDFDEIRKRKDLKAVMPIWHALGKMVPYQEKEQGPILDILARCEEKIAGREKDVEALLLDLYLAGFSSGLIPRGFDDEWQGIVPYLTKQGEDFAFSLLNRGAEMISSLFFAQRQGVYAVLPCLPSSWISGKMTHIQTEEGCHIHMEWTKSQLRKMMVFAENDATIFWDFPKEVKNCRIRRNPDEKGTIIDRKESIQVYSGSWLYLDHFQK